MKFSVYQPIPEKPTLLHREGMMLLPGSMSLCSSYPRVVLCAHVTFYGSTRMVRVRIWCETFATLTHPFTGQVFRYTGGGIRIDDWGGVRFGDDSCFRVLRIRALFLLLPFPREWFTFLFPALSRRLAIGSSPTQHSPSNHLSHPGTTSTA